MYISEQLLDPTEARICLSAPFGVERVVLDNRGSALVTDAWDAKQLAAYRRWVEGFGLTSDVFALDVGSILLDSLVDLEGAKKTRDCLARNIAVAAEAGLTCLKYNVQMVGITRSSPPPGASSWSTSATSGAACSISRKCSRTRATSTCSKRSRPTSAAATAARCARTTCR
jgi:mannonate dehydratase